MNSFADREGESAGCAEIVRTCRHGPQLKFKRYIDKVNGFRQAKHPSLAGLKLSASVGHANVLPGESSMGAAVVAAPLNMRQMSLI